MNKIDVVNSYFSALAKGDVPTAFSFLSENVQWHQPGNNKFSGIKKGAEQIGAMIGAMIEDTAGTFAIAPNGNLMLSADLVACPVRFSGSKGEAKMDMTGIDLFEVKEDKITQIWLFSDDQTAEDSFWNK